MIIDEIKKFRHTKLWASTINIIIGLIILNLIIQFFPFSFDLTANRAHTLSPVTKKTLNEVDDLVTIKAYISDNLPANLLPLKETVSFTLNQYDKAGRQKVKVIFKNPQKNSEAEKEVQSLGIPPMRFSSVKSDQYQVVQGYFGLAIFHAGEKEVIPALQDINNLEYRLTSAIKNIQKEKLPTIGITSGSKELDLNQASALAETLSVNYQLQPIDLTAEDVNFNNFQSLLMIGPKSEITESVQKRLDEFLMSGKGLILLLDKIDVDQNLIGDKIDLKIDQWLNHYGFQLEDKLIIDSSSAMANFQTQQGQFITPYPFWVKTRSENGNQEIPVTSGLESVIFPWASPLKIKENTEFLWKTSPSAKTTDQINNLDPNQKWNFEKNTAQYTLAGLQLKNKSSYFNEEKSADIKLAVVGDANFVSDQSVRSNPENINFILNLVDYLSQDSDLIEIRSKQIKSRPLKQIPEEQKPTYKYASLAVGPILLIGIAGLVRWQRKNYKLIDILLN